MRIDELRTPAPVVEQSMLRHNLDTMTAARPGAHLRPHVKAHKCTSLARLQRDNGHLGFTCATIREVEVMAAAGLGADLLLANEILDARRLGAVVDDGARVTLAVDSPQTVDAAAAGGVREVLVDVNVGLPRCGCAPADAAALADLARARGLAVRGVMGYEGHLMQITQAAERRSRTETAMQLLLGAAADVGGDIVSAGGTGTYADNIWASEIEAGSYLLMDTAYAALNLPFQQALRILGTVISVQPDWAVVDVGLKALGMDHGLPSIADATVWFCSDEHTTFATDRSVAVGDRIMVLPAHVDPTIALHEAMYLVDGDDVIERWPIDMRGW